MTLVIVVPCRPAVASRSVAAQDWIDRVIAADKAAGNNDGLEAAVQDAMAALVDGLIADGLVGVGGDNKTSAASSVLKGIAGLPGGRTLQSLAVPIVYPSGVTPTLVNITSAQYNRKTGWASDGSSNYISTNLSSGNAYASNNISVGVYITNPATSGQYAGAADTINLEPGGTTLQETATASFTPAAGVGYFGMSRAAAAAYSRYVNGASTNLTRASTTLTSSLLDVGRRRAGSFQYASAGTRHAGYYIGLAASQALIAARATTYINSLAGAIA